MNILLARFTFENIIWCLGSMTFIALTFATLFMFSWVIFTLVENKLIAIKRRKKHGKHH